MPGTIKTREKLDPKVSKEDLEREIQLRLKAGAIKVTVEGEGKSRTLITEWNVIGEND